MSKTQYVLAVRGRRWPVCIEADRVDCVADSVNFFVGADLVAASGCVELLVRADAIAPNHASIGHVVGEAIRPVAEPLEAGDVMQLGSAVIAQSILPLWPVLAASAIGFIAGAGAVLSHIGAW